MKILFLTSNKIKAENAKKAMSKYDIDIEQIPYDLIESRSQDPSVIVMEKAQQAFKFLKCPVIVEDSGFFIRALGNFPMTQVKFSLETLGIKNILKMMEGVEDRHAEWRISACFVSGENEHRVFTYVEEGEIAKEIREIKRDMMSDYWRIYIPSVDKGNVLALSEMSKEDVDVWERHFHDSNHFTEMGKWLKEKYLDK